MRRSLAFSVVLAFSHAFAWAPSAAAAPKSNAVVAYEAGVELVRAKDYDEAIAKFDYAAELEPSWSAPVKARADVFATLAEQNRPSAAFTAARADDLERLVVIEPGVDTAARKHEIAALRQQSAAAAKKEAKRRKLMAPAAVTITLSAGFLVAGVLLYSMKPTRDALQPGAYRQERRDDAGIAMMAIGGALAPAAIALGVLAFRQSKHDSRRNDYEATTGRGRPRLAVAPSFHRNGGGLALALTF